METDLVGFSPDQLRRMARGSVDMLKDVILPYEREHPDARIDTAVPFDWLMESPEERRLFGWIYDDESPTFGRPFDLRPGIEEATERILARWRAEVKE
jgi:hypothetical protein